MTWTGASREAGDRGLDAVVYRYLQQLYGDEIAGRYRTVLARTNPGA